MANVKGLYPSYEWKMRSLDEGTLHVRHSVTFCSSVFPADSVLSGLTATYRLLYEPTGLTLTFWHRNLTFKF
jgi:hypothetical protein